MRPVVSYNLLSFTHSVWNLEKQDLGDNIYFTCFSNTIWIHKQICMFISHSTPKLSHDSRWFVLITITYFQLQNLFSVAFSPFNAFIFNLCFLPQVAAESHGYRIVSLLMWDPNLSTQLKLIFKHILISFHFTFKLGFKLWK